MSPVVCQQILTAFKVLRGDDGTTIGAEKLRRLRDNSNYFREGLIAIGCDVFGEWDSPVRDEQQRCCTHGAVSVAGCQPAVGARWLRRRGPRPA